MSMTLISTVTVGSGGAASIDFTSIAATYTDLYLLVSGRTTAASIEMRIQFNGDTASNYSVRRLYGDGSSAASNSTSTTYLAPYAINPSDSSSNVFGNASVYIPNYAGSTAKSVSIDGVAENNATAGYQAINAGLWTGTAAITSIKLIGQTGNWVEYSTASLYGILKGSGGASVS